MTSLMTETTLDDLADAIAAGAVVAGLGESTRFAHEIFKVRDRLFRRLVRRHGFRALAVQDDASVGATLDAYVTGGAGTARSALASAWRPWRTVEMAAALEWIRAFNQDHPDDPVRIFGIKPAQARPADYDAVLDHVRRAAPHRLAELTAHLEPIRTAHEIDEHVQRARGLHPGRPFAEHARHALAIVEQLPGDVVLERMRLIADFHQRSVAGRGDYTGDARTWADAITGHQHRTGRRVAYWDGIAHTSAAPATLGLAPQRGAQPTVGSVLRDHYGTRYVSAAIGFHHGDLGAHTVPEPASDWLDARLGATGRPAHWLDLRDGGWEGPMKARVISGVYDPARDAAEHLAVVSLPDAFDVLVHLRHVTPVQGLTA
ncbi:erythromycin esterase family protein [Microbispora bryophytorum]|uniref:Succinoglycan biosynthesis n=1 Tax=Microbispora bryophytorum TaxID=1460882 RepID=A0A8H9LDN6_9ACTN|nr:erythromycin esterase family protein [Microbispora bryophytorum]MBD3138310.1 erythromycin esterase family protein [Microbispora bryophytorum]TQS04051.1 erythromycin esterase family protein [Microbispora bryophytorum]GGO25903.1 succinoglycan biosynthesis [Microbispora bryophytorum]